MNKTQTKTNQKGTDLNQLHVRGGHIPTRILRFVKGSKGSMCFFKGSLFKVHCIKALLSLNLNALHCHESKWETMPNNRTFELSGCCKQRQSLIWKSRLSGWQAILTVEAHATHCLFQSGVYSKLLSYVISMASDHILVHTKVCCSHKAWVQGIQYQSVVKLVSLPSRLEGLMCTHSGTSSLGLLYSSHLLHTPQSRSDWKGVFGRISKTELGSRTVKHLGVMAHSLVASFLLSLLGSSAQGVGV